MAMENTLVENKKIYDRDEQVTADTVSDIILNDYDCTLTETQLEEYTALRDKHYWMSYMAMGNAAEETKRIYGRAEQIAADTVICGLATAVLTKDLQKAAIAAGICLVKDILKEYKTILEKVISHMLQAEYHWEMAIFYQEVLAKG